jgi:hypothetical protein
MVFWRKIVTEKNIRRETGALLGAKGAETFHQNRSHHTGIGEILTMAGVPKGSFSFILNVRRKYHE